MFTYLVTLWLVYLVYWYLDRKKKFQKLGSYGYNVPPTNIIAGNLHQLAKGDLITMEEWFKNYGQQIGTKGGRIVGWYRGPSPAIWTTCPEVLKEIFIKDAENFIDRPMLDRSDNVPHLINMKGEAWKRARTNLTPTFTAAKMKKMSGIMAKTIDIMVETLEGRINNNNGVVDFNEVYQRLTLDTIGQCALGITIDCQRDEQDRFLKMVRASLDRQIDTTVIVASCFPLFESIIGYIFSKRGRKQTNTTIIDRCREILEKRRKDPPADAPVDALQLCIKASENGKLTEDELVAHLFIFILAGYETTAASLLFTSYALATHPDVQTRLQKEIDDKIGAGGKVTYDNVHEMEYLEMVLNESMRLYPPIPLHIGRWAAEERVICGKTIPAGTGVLAAVWTIHHDPAFWKDPWTFDPERFSKENRDSIQEMSWMPFGDGPRNCIGRRFALMEAKMALVEVMMRYRLSPCHLTPSPLPVRNKGLTLSPVGDKLWLKAEKR